jgi:hypothetical protein
MKSYRRPAAEKKATPAVAATPGSPAASNSAVQETMTVEREEEGSLLDAPETDDGISGGTTHADGTQRGLTSGGNVTTGQRLHEGEAEEKPTNARFTAMTGRAGGEEATRAKSGREAVMDLANARSQVDAVAGSRGGGLPGRRNAADVVADASAGPDANDMKGSTDKQGQQSSESTDRAKKEVSFSDHVAAGYERGGVAGAAAAAFSYVDLHTRDHDATDKNNRPTGATAGTRGRPDPNADTGSGRLPHGVSVAGTRTTPRERERARKRMVAGPDAKHGYDVVPDITREQATEARRNPYINPADDSVTNGTVGGPATPEGARRVTPTGRPGPSPSGSGARPGGPAPDDPTQSTSSEDPKRRRD